jgi:hypothetical protein
LDTISIFLPQFILNMQFKKLSSNWPQLKRDITLHLPPVENITRLHTSRTSRTPRKVTSRQGFSSKETQEFPNAPVETQPSFIFPCFPSSYYLNNEDDETLDKESYTLPDVMLQPITRERRSTQFDAEAYLQKRPSHPLLYGQRAQTRKKKVIVENSTTLPKIVGRRDSVTSTLHSVHTKITPNIMTARPKTVRKESKLPKYEEDDILSRLSNLEVARICINDQIAALLSDTLNHEHRTKLMALKKVGYIWL